MARFSCDVSRWSQCQQWPRFTHSFYAPNLPDNPCHVFGKAISNTFYSILMRLYVLCASRRSEGHSPDHGTRQCGDHGTAEGTRYALLMVLPYLLHRPTSISYGCCAAILNDVLLLIWFYAGTVFTGERNRASLRSTLDKNKALMVTVLLSFAANWMLIQVELL